MLEIHLITCRSCGGESPHDARFCIECGETLASATGPTTKLATPTCQSCGAENVPDARFCGICGRAMPAFAATPEPWPSSVGIPMPSRAHAHQSAPRPTLAPSPAEPPMVAPALPQPITGAPRRHGRRHGHTWHHGGPPPAVIVAIVGFGALFVLHALSMPAILLVVAATFLVHQAEHGRVQPAIRTIAMVGAGILVLTNPRFWPILLIGFFVMKLFGGRRVF